MYSINNLSLEEIQLIIKSIKEYQSICKTLAHSPYSKENDTEIFSKDLEKTEKLLNKLNNK